MVLLTPHILHLASAASFTNVHVVQTHSFGFLAPHTSHISLFTLLCANVHLIQVHSLAGAGAGPAKGPTPARACLRGAAAATSVAP